MPQEKILYIEHDRTLTYDNGTFVQSSVSDVKELFTGAVVPLALLNIYTLKLPNHLSEEEQKIHVEIQMFEEGKLNNSEEYVIDYIRHDLPTENSYLFEVFALSHAKAADYFSAALSQSKVIDLITPGFMVYESLYDTDSLPKQNDLFIYLGEDESYAAIYQDGTYIAHRSSESLTTLAVETGMDLGTFICNLAELGVIEERYPPNEYGKCSLIQDHFSHNVERLVHTINHKRGLFGLTDITHIYLDFQGNTIPGLETIFDAYDIHNVEIIPLSRPNNPPKELHNLLCAEYLSRHTGKKKLNLSPFGRKDLWYKRESGKFLALTAASLFIALCIPLALSWALADKVADKEKLAGKLVQTEKETTQLARTLNEQNKHFTRYQNEIHTLNEEIVLIQGTQETSDLITQMHLKRRQMLSDVTTELGRYRLGTLQIEQNGSKEMSVQVIAEYQKRNDIAKLMSALYARGYQNVETREIALDNNMYNAVVKVTR